jgi:hypothetical protein
MQKLQVLFPDPIMVALRKLASIEDRPVSEIIRRAVDREVIQKASLLNQERKQPPPSFPTFAGGQILATATEMKALLYEDDSL